MASWVKLYLVRTNFSTESIIRFPDMVGLMIQEASDHYQQVSGTSLGMA